MIRTVESLLLYLPINIRIIDSHKHARGSAGREQSLHPSDVPRLKARYDCGVQVLLSLMVTYFGGVQPADTVPCFRALEQVNSMSQLAQAGEREFHCVRSTSLSSRSVAIYDVCVGSCKHVALSWHPVVSYWKVCSVVDGRGGVFFDIAEWTS